MKTLRFNPISLKNASSYLASLQKNIKIKLKRKYQGSKIKGITAADIHRDILDINRYPNLASLNSQPTMDKINFFDRSAIELEAPTRDAIFEVLQGSTMFEHTAAGIGSRLNKGLIAAGKKPLGSKFTFTPKDLATAINKQHEYKDLAPYSLGIRHMLVQSYILKQKAKQYNLPLKSVLNNQYLQVICNQQMVDETIQTFRDWSFFGFNNKKVLFLIEKDFPGIGLENGEVFIDPYSDHKVHNHGIIRMQSAMDKNFFYINDKGKKIYLDRQEYRNILSRRLDLVSFNIEDLNFLSIKDPMKGPFEEGGKGFGLAREWVKKGYEMIVEVLPQKDPTKGGIPQKGGLIGFDKKLNKYVMVESFQLGHRFNDSDPNKAIEKYKEIHYLNRNFNHYPKPVNSWDAIYEKGLPTSISVSGNHMYNEAPQGDVNHLVKTAFAFVNSSMSSLKTINEIGETLKIFREMDKTPGFLKYADQFAPIDLKGKPKVIKKSDKK